MLSGDELDQRPSVRDPSRFGIAVIGSGNIVENAHIPSYLASGFRVEGIASRTRENAARVAHRHGLAKVYPSFEAAVSDPAVAVVDIAVPPDFQPAIIRVALDAGKHVLAQKPLAQSFEEAHSVVEYAEQKGLLLAVNQNGRYDPSINAARRLIAEGILGSRLYGWLTMMIMMPWQSYYKEPRYQQLMMLNMSVHHMDQLRWLFGDPTRVFALARKVPDQQFSGETIAHYSVEYGDGFFVSCIDDGTNWSRDFGITYRFQGTDGLLKGEIGWPKGTFSTLAYQTIDAGNWVVPEFSRQWFPDAFSATMGELLSAIEDGRSPSNSGRDNLGTMKLVSAAYQSRKERRSVALNEID